MTDSKESKVLETAFDSPTFGEDGSFRLDKPVGSASISPCGRDVVLASRQGLHIIDLDCPWSPPRHLAHYTPWEVADVQWSPFAFRDYWVVSTSNQKALVWNLAMINSQASIEHVLHAHSRAITDINFSAHHPDILATCAVDSFVHCWDLRHPARPAMTFCDWFAGATQVKWNRQDAHILASSHDKFLRIWDDRKGAYPLRSIEAHATKIYGVDWNRTATNNVATCSLDKTIKFWDYTGGTDTPDMIIQAPFPVWRARHTPFGSALLAMPQRGDHDLHLYSRDWDRGTQDGEVTRPVHRFEGHEDQVKEFLWRPRGNIVDGVDHREFQLVSWGTDRILRLHRVDEDMLCSVGHEKGKQVDYKVNITRRNATYKTFRESLSKFGNKFSQEPLASGIQSHDREGFKSFSTWNVGKGGSLMDSRRDWGADGPTRSMIGRRGPQRQDIDAISWMRGVKIGKREVTSSGMHQSFASMFSPSLKTDRIWDTFELGEEITHVGDKFGKVKFDKIDMPNRFVIVSLAGPWGPEDSSTYVKTRIEFPKGYPEEATPAFSVEKTASMSSETPQKIASELQLVADAYQARQRNSLEAILRYLLGEQNLEESLIWLKDRPDHTDLDLMQDPGLSSSDEDDDVGKYTSVQAQGMDMSDNMITISNAQYNVPLPNKVCGALWASDGRLVCFFPSRDRTPSLLDLSLKNSDRSSRSHKTLFEGFGRLYNRSPTPKNVASALETIESDGSDSDILSMSSSGSSSSSDDFGGPRHHFIPSSAWHGDNSETQRALSIEDSQLSSGGTGPVKSTGSKSVSFVSVHDFKDILPAKKSLVQGYVIGGSHCCAHNAEVAARFGHQDIADAWGFVDLMLREQVPLDMVQHPHKDEPIMVVARNASSPLARNDSAVDLSLGSGQETKQVGMKGSIKWGHHPFGRWMVDSLFSHFEQLADVQMLAMLSCVFSQSRGTKKPTITAGLDERHRHAGRFPVRYQSGSRDREFSRDYFQSEEIARSLLKPNVSDMPVRLNSRKTLSMPHSANSSVGASNSDPMTPFSTGGTPPSLFRSNRTNMERTDSQSASISTSPEQHRHAHRSNSNLASAFTASFSRPFSFTASASSSPPTTYSRKRLSPAGSYLGAAPSVLTRASTSFFGKSYTITEDPKSAYSLSASDAEDEMSGPKIPVFNIRLKNQDQFHNDGYVDVPLLDPSQEWRYQAYRESYAHMLYIWQVPLASCEILKYSSAPTKSRSSEHSQSLPLIAIGKITAAKTFPDPEKCTLILRNHCTTCATALSLQPSNQDCPFCTSPRSPLICLFCASLIRGLSSPCLFCGHVLHFSCRSRLLALSQSPTSAPRTQLCISGCGCDCASHAVVEVDYPSRRKSSASMTVTGDSTVDEQEQAAWRDATPEDEDAWEDVAYESLARNLRGRYLTPRPSRIWRGGT